MTDRAPYRPSNGTEFEWFYARNCRHCTKDDPENEIGCPLIVQAMAGKEGPAEWIVDPKCGPLCTAYTEGDADPAPCPDTLEMF